MSGRQVLDMVASPARTLRELIVFAVGDARRVALGTAGLMTAGVR